MLTLKNLDLNALENALISEITRQTTKVTGFDSSPMIDELNEIHDELQRFLSASYSTTAAIEALRLKVSNMIRTLDVRLADEADEEDV
jgi:seryl-tRNA synthetase